ncbi:CinA family protein [Roseateles sp. GG27B]
MSCQATEELLGLSAADVVGLRAETEPYTNLIAGGIRGRLRATWGLCESGAAGPSDRGDGTPSSSRNVGEARS